MSGFYNKQRKRLGQNYINDSGLIKELIEKAGIKSGDYVVEPGAGEGVITAELLASEALVNAIELDQLNCQGLKQKFEGVDKFDLYCGDVLGYRPKSDHYTVFGNPPFGITSKILKHFLLNPKQPENAYLIMQLEAFERLVGTKENSLVSLKINYLYSDKILGYIDSKYFTPAPQVESVFTSFTRLRSIDKQTVQFFDFIDAVYARSQGTIRGNLKKWLSNLQVKRLGQDNQFNPTDSITALDINQWQAVYAFYQSL